MMYPGYPFRYTAAQMEDFRRRCLCECHHDVGWDERPMSVENHLCQPCVDDAYTPWPALLESLPR